MIDLDQQTPPEVMRAVAARVRLRRKELKLTQAELAHRAGVSFGSYKRFEQTAQIAFESLVKISFALDCEGDFNHLFERRGYASIQEVIDDVR